MGILWLLQIIILSILSILLMHYFYDFLKTTFTVEKKRDLIYKPDERYKEMYKTIYKNKQPDTNNVKRTNITYPSNVSNNNTSDATFIQDLPNNSYTNVPIKDEISNMKNELKDYLKSI
mgnify:CR=1 FL=1|tara:strand:- start:134 stop:490 length:357 start_codon:yes stop_codon:yes gene_type:complete